MRRLRRLRVPLICLIFVMISIATIESSQSSQTSMPDVAKNMGTSHDYNIAIIAAFAVIVSALLGLIAVIIERRFVKTRDFERQFDNRLNKILLTNEFHNNVDLALYVFLEKNKAHSMFLDHLTNIIRPRILTPEQLRPFIKDIFNNLKDF